MDTLIYGPRVWNSLPAELQQDVILSNNSNDI